MATIPKSPPKTEVEYPTGDNRPVGETPIHRDNLLYTVYVLRAYFANDPMTYVSGNMFLYYVPGNKWRHLAPDVFVVRGISNCYRDAYFTWEEGGRGPDFVIEMTSASTRDEDMDQKLAIYRDTLRVREYFLFDPYAEYLNPPLQGYRLVEGRYDPIAPVEGRLPSEVLGLSLERSGTWVRIFDPATGEWLPFPPEIHERYQQSLKALEQSEAALREERAALEAQQAVIARQAAELQRAEQERQEMAKALEQADAERRKLLAELEETRRRVAGEKPQHPG